MSMLEMAVCVLVDAKQAEECKSACAPVACSFEARVVQKSMECEEVSHGDGRLMRGDLIGVEVVYALHDSSEELTAGELPVAEGVCTVCDSGDEARYRSHLVRASEGGDCTAEILFRERAGSVNA
jgi:hypothetical protein